MFDLEGVVLVLDTQFAVLFVNRDSVDSSRGHGKWRQGMHYGDPLAQELVTERINLIKRAVAERRPKAITGMMWGALSRTTYRPFASDSGDDMVLVTSTSLVRDEVVAPAGVEHVRAESHDLGHLAVLSERELEVLALVGRGLSNEQIANELHRSARTVQGHRMALGSKIDASHRVDVARLAIEAGLADMSLDEVRRVWRGSQRGLRSRRHDKAEPRG